MITKLNYFSILSQLPIHASDEDCSACMQLPGCVHGSCTKPFECKCEDGWSGMFCDKRKLLGSKPASTLADQV